MVELDNLFFSAAFGKIAGMNEYIAVGHIEFNVRRQRMSVAHANDPHFVAGNLWIRWLHGYLDDTLRLRYFLPRQCGIIC